MLSRETETTLQLYADGNLSNRELAEWLSQAEYDLDLPEGERDQLAALGLLVLEEAEGLRSGEEILQAVAAILAPESREHQVLVKRTTSSTAWDTSGSGLTITRAGSPVQRAGI